MRKYFLLSALALMISVITNKTYADAIGNLEIQALVTLMDELQCDPLYLNICTSDVSQGLTAIVDTNGNITVSNGSVGTGLMQGEPAKCTLSNNTFTSVDKLSVMLGSVYFSYIPFGSEEFVPSEATISDFTFNISDDAKTAYIGGTYTFPANMGQGLYHANVPIAYLYE
ncbi:MAG: hypothetical protein IJF12_02605 [Alphaproteobacteria bacterium]|nr:hypothetical protein [Alphaproteobacteria bacterium]